MITIKPAETIEPFDVAQTPTRYLSTVWEVGISTALKALKRYLEVSSFLTHFLALTTSTRGWTVSSEDTHAAHIELRYDSAINPRRRVCAKPVARFLIVLLASLREIIHF